MLLFYLYYNLYESSEALAKIEIIGDYSMNYVGRLSIILISLMSSGSRAFIYEAKVLRKWNPNRRSYHYFIGCSDFHDKSHTSNQPQLAEIEHVLKRLDKSCSKVLIEDLSSRNNQGRFSCGRFYVNSRGGILGGLAKTCEAVGLDVSNVEFRYCRVTSLGPVLNNLQERLDRFPSVTDTKVATLVEEVHSVINEIKAFNDGSTLNTFYGRGIQDVENELKQLHMIQHPDVSIAEYLAAHSTAKNRVELLKRLLTFDSGLLDLKLAHDVVNAQDKEKVVAIAGGSHIAKVSEVLEKVGYEKVHASKINYTNEYDLNRCLGSHIIENKYCVKPQPISLDFLSEYVKK